MALCMGLSAWVSMSCLCVVSWMTLFSVFWGAMCAKGSVQWLEEEDGGVHLANQGCLDMEHLVAQDGSGREESVCAW